jgi:hypothetical protein
MTSHDKGLQSFDPLIVFSDVLNPSNVPAIKAIIVINIIINTSFHWILFTDLFFFTFVPHSFVKSSPPIWPCDHGKDQSQDYSYQNPHDGRCFNA